MQCIKHLLTHAYKLDYRWKTSLRFVALHHLFRSGWWKKKKSLVDWPKFLTSANCSKAAREAQLPLNSAAKQAVLCVKQLQNYTSTCHPKSSSSRHRSTRQEAPALSVLNYIRWQASTTLQRQLETAVREQKATHPWDFLGVCVHAGDVRQVIEFSLWRASVGSAQFPLCAGLPAERPSAPSPTAAIRPLGNFPPLQPPSTVL